MDKFKLQIQGKLIDYGMHKFYKIENIDHKTTYGILMNFTPISVFLLTEKGILIIPVGEIVELSPYPASRCSFSDDDYVQLLEECGIITFTKEEENNGTI